MKGFSDRWTDFPDYIIGITKEIWEDRGVAALRHYYSEDIPVRSPMGVQRGNAQVMASTMATIHEFPDRELLGEDVIWSEHETGLLSSHRLLTRATHTQDGAFGPATGKHWVVRVIADCAARADTIFDEWLVRDYGGMVRQLGLDPRDYAGHLIDREGGASRATRPFTPEVDVPGDYRGVGNDNAWGLRYETLLSRIMDKDFAVIHSDYDRAVIGEYAGATTAIGRDAVTRFWIGLRSAFPNAEFRIHHRIGMDGGMMSPRAAIRWSLDGLHEGWGAFGAPTGARVHVMGISHAEFGPFGPGGIGLRREFTLYDEVAIWKQILLATR